MKIVVREQTERKELVKNERHFSVVILKDKTGKKIQQLLQKTGEVALDRKNVKTPADVRSVYPYTPTPVKNNKYPFYVKRKTPNPKS